MLNYIKNNWLYNIKKDLLAGIVVALALIPEAIAFSIIAGVDPKVGLYASFSMTVIIAIVGARSGMVSAATGAMALLMVTLVKEHGLQYLMAVTILTGVIQIIAGYLKLGNLMRFVSKPVITGFVNALAILIFMAQLPELTDATWSVYLLTASGLAIVYLFPLIPIIGKLIPSPLVCIISLTIVAALLGLDVRTVGDMGQLPDMLPIFLLPNVPLTFQTLQIILPYSLALAAVGLLESMMTATIIDDLTSTTSNKNQECKGQGIANIGTGLLGGMAGCAMIGQSMINIKSGGRSRLSTLFSGIALLIMILFLSDILKLIPMAALVAVMIMVSISTFSWDSIKNIKHHPLSSNIVMLATVAVVVITHNLALGVFIGVLLSALFFAHQVSQCVVVKSTLVNEQIYTVRGQLFFASADQFSSLFDLNNVAECVKIDLTLAHFWDLTAITALDKVIIKLRSQGATTELIGMNEATANMINKFAVHDDPNLNQKLLASH
ncbi:sodium-independent anion transporter [Photobacterium kishitanii]|uniref:SulP family inorganic anion transporter n=1 Tax=Photobacterium kishitanii TaxID=318456 RepID=UPI000D158709|nr:SulP family inorganic anion transporter [Photobacterium kishitanii]PSU24133.1 sodium-independent anion transporter [Photobacterium kishitanii]PSV07364.1 sodium-independent anion transporter [Photobacterium kishitanii]PSV17760.1 sodium-independent anion transporter [Photobacterium kishitanii]PSV77056.1 sodium-independent anion transporter [Photobacterium kishitanii]